MSVRRSRPRTVPAVPGLVVLAAVAFVPVPARAAERFGPMTVSPLSTQVGESPHGYVEHRVLVENSSLTEAHRVRLLLPKRSFASGNHIRSITRSAVVAPRSSMTVSLLQPPLAVQGDERMVVVIDGRHAGDVAVPYPIGQHIARWNRKSAFNVLLSRAVNRDDFEKNFQNSLYAQVRRSSRGSRRSREKEFELVKAESDVRNWTTSWLGWTCYDGVVVTEADLQDMPSAVRAALWRYVECGGSLLVIGDFAVPEPWPRLACEAPPGLKAWYVGFGQVIASPQAAGEHLGREQLLYVRKAWIESRQPWAGVSNAGEANRVFPVVDDVGVSIRFLFLLMLGFAVVIGPVNFIILLRKKKLIWMLWTVPAVSVLTSLLIVVYAWVSEGIRPVMRVETLTILDQRAHRASTLGLLAYYCPLTPRGGLHFGYDTELTPEVETRTYGAGAGRDVDWSADQHFRSGWISARLPAHFMIRKSEQRRERLELMRQPDGSLAALNGLGTDIRSLWLADGDGRVYACGGIPAGKRGTLLAEAEAAGNELGRLRRAYHKVKWQDNYAGFTNAPAQSLLAGTYIATLDACPFLEKGLERVGRSRERSVVYGILDTESIGRAELRAGRAGAGTPDAGRSPASFSVADALRERLGPIGAHARETPIMPCRAESPRRPIPYQHVNGCRGPDQLGTDT
ncbi:MAG: hypothetical protein JXR37_32095 [Kiritimatiellae bacterium]|nr:hypothetical protein [Kiritimatiellia bacterium]